MNDTNMQVRPLFSALPGRAVEARVLDWRCLPHWCLGAHRSAPGRWLNTPPSPLANVLQAFLLSPDTICSKALPGPAHRDSLLLVLFLTPGSFFLRQTMLSQLLLTRRPFGPLLGPSALKYPAGSLFSAFGSHSKKSHRRTETLSH